MQPFLFQLSQKPESPSIHQTMELGLERFAAVQFSAMLWRTPAIVAKMKHLFMGQNIAELSLPLVRSETVLYKRKTWTGIIHYIDSMLDDYLPKPLKGPVMYIAEQMGIRIFEWLRVMTARLIKYSQIEDFPRHIEYYIDHIEWTAMGAIDEVKVFKTRYEDPSIENDFFMWWEACNYCLEDCARELWTQSSLQSIKETLKQQINTKFDDDFCLAAYWQGIIDKEMPDIKRTLVRNGKIRDVP